MAAESDESTASADEASRSLQVLNAEYAILAAAWGAAWSASLARTTIFLAVLSAAGVALGFAVQGGTEGNFTTLALIVLPLLLFLGVTTFERLVQVQRDLYVYTVGMNRIRHFFQQVAPASRPYFVLSAHDDALALYRSAGTGMSRRPPRFPLVHMVAQTQGIVGVITGVVAGAFVGLAVASLRAADLTAWLGAVLAFAVTVGALFVYWQRSLDEIRGAVRPMNPTPSEEVDASF